MEVKKSPAADLENSRLTNMLIGFILVLALIYVSLEYTQRDEKIKIKDFDVEPLMEQEMTPLTQQSHRIAPQTIAPPPSLLAAKDKKAPVVADKMNVVDNQTVVKEVDTETSEQTGQNVVVGTGTGTENKTADETTPTAADDLDPKVFDIVEQLPEFPGGITEYLKWLTRNLRYPMDAQKMNIQGKVIVQFIVNKDGMIVNPKIVHSLSPSCDKEVMRVIKKMPKWKPGQEHRKPVRVKYSLPVIFKLS